MGFLFLSLTDTLRILKLFKFNVNSSTNIELETKRAAENGTGCLWRTDYSSVYVLLKVYLFLQLAVRHLMAHLRLVKVVNTGVIALMMYLVITQPVNVAGDVTTVGWDLVVSTVSPYE